MLHPDHLKSLLPKPENKKVVKRGVAVTLSVLLCAPVVPACLDGLAFADESALEQDQAGYEADVETAYAIAALGLAGNDDVDAIVQILSAHGYTKTQVLSLSISKLQDVDGALAQSISALQRKLLAGNQVEPSAPEPPASEVVDPTPTEPEQPETPVDPESPEMPETPEDPDAPAVPGDNEEDPSTPSVDPDITDIVDSEGDEPTNASDSGSDIHTLPPFCPATGEVGFPEWSYEGSREYTHRPVQQNLTTTKFIAVIGEQARQLAAESDLYASVMIAQAILESDSGNSQLAQNPNFNLFGIKGSYEGQSASFRTLEDDGSGNMDIITADFRKYPNFHASLEDYVSLLTQEKARFYRGALKSVAATYEDACKHLQGRYATDSSYAEKLVGIIEAYDLTRYDEPLDYELVEQYVVPMETKDIAISKTVDLASGETVLEERDLVDLATEVTSHLGEDYVWGGNTCGAFDCSGLVSYAYKHALGVEIPRTTYYQCTQGEDVDFADLHTGDLVFFANSDGICCHVGMYLGEGCYIEAPQQGDVVKITSLDEKLPTFAKRLLKTQPVTETEDEPTVPVAVYEQNAVQAEPQKAKAATPTVKQSAPKRDGQSIWDAA